MLANILQRTSFGTDLKFGDNQSGETFATARCIRSYVGPYVGSYVGSYTLRRVGWTIRTYAIRGDPEHAPCQIIAFLSHRWRWGEGRAVSESCPYKPIAHDGTLKRVLSKQPSSAPFEGLRVRGVWSVCLFRRRDRTSKAGALKGDYLWLSLEFALEVVECDAFCDLVGQLGALAKGGFHVIFAWSLVARLDKLGEQRGLGHTRAIAERLAVPVRYETISEQKRDETKPTSPSHCL